MKNKIKNKSRTAGVGFVALMVFVMPLVPAQAADYSDYGSDYGSTYVGSDYSDYGSTYVGSDSNDYGSTYIGSDSSYDYGSTYIAPDTTDYGSTYIEPDIDYGSTYIAPNSGCTFGCGGGGGGGGCTFGCGGSTTPKPAPTCVLSISPSQVNYNGSATLSWSTSNASQVSLSGFGNVSLNSSRTVNNITQPTTYTLTASGNGKTVTCSKSVTVKQQQPAPTCSLNVSPSTINKGDDVDISWTSNNASYASLSGFGSVSLDGSRTDTNVTNDTTYTLTVTGNGKTVTCSDSVNVKTVVSKAPTCDMYVDYPSNYSQYNYGQPVVLHWSSKNADDAYINNGIGDVSTKGSRTIYPKDDITYKGTFTNDNGQKAICSVKVNVDTYLPPLPHPTTPYINLSAVPYTGLDLGPVGTALYWSFLVLWCALAAYLVAVKRVHMALVRWYKRVLFSEDTHVVAHAEPAVAGMSQSDLAKLAAMLHGTHTVEVEHTAAPAKEDDGVDPFILSQINRAK